MTALTGNEQLIVEGITAAGGPASVPFFTTTQAIANLSGSAAFSSPPPIGNVAPNTAKFTTVEATGLVTLDGGFSFNGATVNVATMPNFARDFFNITGNAPNQNGRWFIGSNSDSTNTLAAGVLAYPFLYINRTFGGTTTAGSRFAQLNVLNAKTAVTGSNTVPQMVTTGTWFQGNANMGGTALNNSGAAIGSAYAFYPQATILPGGTFYNSVSLFEGDIGIVPTTQTLTLGGGDATNDVITVTFTSASLAGSPVAVNYTVKANNTALNIVNGLTAAVRANSVLRNAGFSFQTADGNTKAFIVWPSQDTASVAVTSTGSGIYTLNTAVPGGSAWQKVGIAVTRINDGATSGANDYRDAAISINDDPQPLTLSSGQWKNGLIFGGGTGGGWPIAPTGTMIGAAQPYIFQVLYDAPFAAPQVQFGIDFQVVNFTLASGFAIRTPGFTVDGHGTHAIGGSALTPSATGLAIDALGSYGTGTPTIANGGGGGGGQPQGNYFVGDILTDAYGGQYQVTTVSSQGAVTGITVLNQPSVTGATPSNPVTTTGGSGGYTGTAIPVTLNITWAGANQVTINPSAIGNTVVGKTSVGATTDVGGHLMIPFCSGTPTGVPTNASQGIALRYDTSAHKLWAYDNGTNTWKGVALT